MEPRENPKTLNASLKELNLNSFNASLLYLDKYKETIIALSLSFISFYILPLSCFVKFLTFSKNNILGLR